MILFVYYLFHVVFLSQQGNQIKRNIYFNLIKFYSRTGRVLMYQRNENSAQLTYLRTLILPSSTINHFSSKKIEKNFKNLPMELYKKNPSNKNIF